jgi:hypothetical protein
LAISLRMAYRSFHSTTTKKMRNCCISHSIWNAYSAQVVMLESTTEKHSS